MSDVDIAITVERDQSLDETILAAVSRAGFVVDRAMPKLRTIYVHGPVERMESVKSIKGVAGVRAAGGYQLPPAKRTVPQ